jgi:hypothetical protein
MIRPKEYHPVRRRWTGGYRRFLKHTHFAWAHGLKEPRNRSTGEHRKCQLPFTLEINRLAKRAGLHMVNFHAFSVRFTHRPADRHPGIPCHQTILIKITGSCQSGKRGKSCRAIDYRQQSSSAREPLLPPRISRAGAALQPRSALMNDLWGFVSSTRLHVLKILDPSIDLKIKLSNRHAGFFQPGQLQNPAQYPNSRNEAKSLGLSCVARPRTTWSRTSIFNN